MTDKTDLLLQLLAKDFQHEKEILILDTTGNFAPLAADTLPSPLRERALYLDPADTDYPVGINFMEDIPKDTHQPFIEQFCATYDMLFPAGEGTLSVMKSTARSLLQPALMPSPTATASLKPAESAGNSRLSESIHVGPPSAEDQIRDGARRQPVNACRFTATGHEGAVDVQVDPVAVAARNVSLDDIRRVLADQFQFAGRHARLPARVGSMDS